MSSTGEDRSLASGIPIPQWMRTKTENYGFDPSTLSPPQHEGDFFYIKLPKTQFSEQSNLRTSNEVLEVKEKAFFKHTESCKQFIPKVQNTVQVSKPKIIKPMGVDDGFKGEGAACGASVVEVAHQMLAGQRKSFKPLNRGETEGSLAPPPASYFQKCRDSKSLPSSPTTSPESSPLTRRKNKPQNGLFGVGFNNPDPLNESEVFIDKKSGSSWILSSLFSAKDTKETGKDSTTYEKNLMIFDANSKKLVKYEESSSRERVNVAVEIQAISPSPAPANKPSIFKSKPHLRDLNLLTPSSM